MPLGAWLHWSTEKHHRPPNALNFIDQLFVVIAGFVFPEAWPGLAVISLSSVATTVSAFGMLTGLISSVAVCSVMVGFLIVNHDPDLAYSIAGYAIASVVTIGAIGGIGRKEQRLAARQQNMLDTVDAVLWECGFRDHHYTYISRQAEKMLGYSLKQWYEPHFWYRNTHPDDIEIADIMPYIEAGRGGSHEFEYRMIRADGETIWVRDLVHIEIDDAGMVVGIRGVKIDITQRKHNELQLSRFGDIAQNIRTGLLVFSFDDPTDPSTMRIADANVAAGRIRGFDPASAAGKLASDLVPKSDERGLTKLIHRVFTTGETVVLERFPDREPDEGPVYAASAFRLPGNLVGFSFEDVTEQRRAELALRRQATLDPLTGLANRALLQEHLADVLTVASLENRQVALLLLDLNSFKEVNDSLGHMTGDRLLQEVGRRLTSLVRSGDTVARLGGDEFAMLVTSDVSVDSAHAISARISEALSEPFHVDGVTIQSNASIGIALYPMHGSDAESLVQHADVAMYVAKRAGHHSALYEPAHDQNSVGRLILIGELHNSTENDELVLYYQPKLDLNTGKMVGSEALIRWQHPTHGLIQPLEFVRLAEVSGFIKPMTRWVIDTAITQAKKWQRMGLGAEIAVNVSVRNLYEDDLVDWLEERLRYHDLPPSLLKVEITESEIMEDVALTKAVLTRIGAIGVGLSIDDFGTGYSSLSHLRQLPINEIKIDRTFVSSMLLSDNDAVIVQSMVNLAHNLGLEVVAEGVEDAQTQLALGAIGCDRAQGYYFSRPIPADALTRWAYEREFELADDVMLVAPI